MKQAVEEARNLIALATIAVSRVEATDDGATTQLQQQQQHPEEEMMLFQRERWAVASFACAIFALSVVSVVCVLCGVV